MFPPPFLFEKETAVQRSISLLCLLIALLLIAGGAGADEPHAGPAAKSESGKKRIVFIAGRPSHGYSEHEHRAGCLLLAECLKKAFPNVETAVCRDGWPRDRKALDGADAIVIFSDGSKSHPMLRHLGQVEKLMKRGVGLACIHYAVTVPKEKGGDQMKDWIGGYYEAFWSVNPFWTAEFAEFPDHPVAHGLKPFSIKDEWYYHMRFIDGMEGVTPILTAVPPDSTREGPDGPSSGNPTVRSEKGKAEHVAWARQRPDGGRGFGFTGGHWHWSWANDNFRKAVLNGIAWVAKLEIPLDGVPSNTPTYEELKLNQAKPEPAGFDREKVRKKIRQWK
ncbi:MAG: ThuA domain-containing protein [Pirellulales bacterium]|nr:ThuA domain-containing protein [Pirellulales bacterium]